MKKAIALLLAGAMLASMSMNAFAYSETAATDQTVEGENDVKNPIINYQIPLNLEFAVDAFQKAGDDSQIYSPTFAIINKSDVALSASISSKLTTTDVVTKQKAADVTTTDTNHKVKEIYLETVAAKTATTTAATGLTKHSGKTPATINSQPGTQTFTFTDGPSNGSAAATFTVDLTGLAVKDSSSSGGADYTITFLAGDSGKETFWGEVTSGTVTGTATADEPTPKEVAAGFVGKSFKIKSAGKLYTFTGAAATPADNTIIFTADVQEPIFATAPTSFKFEVGPGKGTPAEVSLDLVSSPPAYVDYKTVVDGKDVYGSATDAKSVFGEIDAAVTPKEALAGPLSFVLEKGTYVTDYDAGDPTLFSTMAASDKGVGAFRFRGTVNPNVAWQAQDFKIQSTFSIAPVGAAAYSAVEWLDSVNAQNVAAPPVVSAAPTVNGGTLSVQASTLVSNDKISIPYSLGGGDLAATGITSVRHKLGSAADWTNSAQGTVYEDPTTTVGNLVLTTAFTTAMTSNGGMLEITFDDSKSTKVEITFTK